MTRIAGFLFDSMFQARKKVSDQEKKFVAIAVSLTVILSVVLLFVTL